MSAIDYSQPLSIILKESTKEVHEELEHSEAAIAMSKGKLELDDYVRFLMMLYQVYSALERALDQHSSHPVLEPTYNPAVLARTSSLGADIAFFLEVPESEWQSHPIYREFLSSPPPAMTAYVSRLESLANFSDPSPLLGHSYTRYLGDLSGGQSLRHTLAKAYGLDESTCEGLTFFSFRQLESSERATLGDMKRIKEWFREGANQGAGNSKDVKVAVSQEAMEAFSLNKGLFAAIITTSQGSRKDPAISQARKADNEGYSITQFVTFIAAIGLTHFLLVVLGFTGPRGYSKLMSIEEWLFGSA